MASFTCKQVSSCASRHGRSSHTGGGIVFDSVEEDEYIETINKLGANVKCIEDAESEPPISCQNVR